MLFTNVAQEWVTISYSFTLPEDFSVLTDESKSQFLSFSFVSGKLSGDSHPAPLIVDNVSLVDLTVKSQAQKAHSRYAAVDSYTLPTEEAAYTRFESLNGRYLDLYDLSQTTDASMVAQLVSEGWRYATQAELTDLVSFTGNNGGAVLKLANNSWFNGETDGRYTLLTETDNGDYSVEVVSYGVGAVEENAGVTLGDDYVTAVLVREIDSDDDGTPDTLDAFPFNSAEQADADNDKLGDNQDLDANNDGVLDANPLSFAEIQDITLVQPA